MSLVPVLLLVACAKPAAVPAPSSPAAAAVPAAWLGRWTGPEGTWLDIAGSNGAWTVTVSNLDGPRTFAAVAGNGTLAFERDGRQESLHAADGAGTGMKWLVEKHDCLVIRSGEGFCRD